MIENSVEHFPVMLKVPQVAKHLKVNVKTVRRMVRDGSLRTVKIGRRNFINREELLSYLAPNGEQCLIK